MAVTLLTVHHEGAGSPSDDVQRFSSGGYCYGIGTTRWERFRAPADNWATLGFNHKDLTICLSGDRTHIPVTDNDIALIHGAFLDCLNRDEVTDAPLVRAHRNSPGSSTVCPGDQTMARWNDVVNACRTTPIPPKELDVLAAATNKDGHLEVFGIENGAVQHKWRKPDGSWGPWVSFDGSGFADVAVAVNTDGRLELFATNAGGVQHRWQKTAGGGWSDWAAL